METEEKSTKSKRNSEKRKEKSRYAAKCRRSKESEIFSNLAKVLPIKESCAHLDKATIMRLGIAYLRIRDLFSKSPLSNLPPAEEEDKFSLVALGGIIMILTVEGDIVYVSNNVNAYLGLTQIELMGQNIFDVSHPCDHKEIKDILSGKNEKEGRFSLFLRMKSTLTSKGRSVNLKSATYKVLRIIGTMVKTDDSKSGGGRHFTAIGSPIPHPANIEIPLGSYTFLSKHSLDMKFTYADERMQSFLGYSPENLIGKSLYEFHHVLDNKDIQAAFKSLFAKGQSETDQYRFLVKDGGYIWVYTQATVIYSERGSKPESVVCVNYVVSEHQNESEIYSSFQLEDPVHKPVPSTSKVIVKITPPKTLERPQHSTSKIFAPRTPEMNKGFLTFADDDSGCTLMKDEPDDLTHLAPTAGDVCISLDASTINSTIDEFKFPSQLNDNSFTLLDQKSKAKLFVSCLDDASGSLSPSLSKSPDVSSLPSLCSVNNDPISFEDSSVKSFLSFDGNDNSDDFSFKAPYISMSEGDDLPLLMNADFWPTSNYSNCASSVESSCAASPMEYIPSDDNVDKVLRNSKDNESVASYQDPGGGTVSNFLLQQSFQDCLGELESRKRNNVELYSVDSEMMLSKKRKHHDTASGLEQSNSVLMNLLVTGHDINAGYICINTRKKTSPDKASKMSNS